MPPEVYRSGWTTSEMNPSTAIFELSQGGPFWVRPCGRMLNALPQQVPRPFSQRQHLPHKKNMTCFVSFFLFIAYFRLIYFVRFMRFVNHSSYLIFGFCFIILCFIMSHSFFILFGRVPLCCGNVAAPLRCCCGTAAVLHCCGSAAVLRRYHCGTAAVLLRYCCGTAAALLWHCCGTAAVLLRYCCGTAAALLRYCCGTAAVLLL